MAELEMNVSPRTIAVTAGRPLDEGGPLNEPIVLASNFRAGPEYSRTHGTRTWAALEEAIGLLESGRCLTFSSGMAVASAIVFALRPEIVVVPSVSYLGVRALLGDLTDRKSLQTREVAIQNTLDVVAALDRAEREAPSGSAGVVLWIETPTNPTLDVADLPRLCREANARGIRVVVDSTFATPMGTQPLAHGATVVMHSGTKFIGGHSDLLIGAAVTNDDAVYDALARARVVQGATPGALEAFLALRGLRTLPLRYEASTRSAEQLAALLGSHPHIESVRQAGPMLSFVVRGGADAADRVCASTTVIVPATSLGGVESTMERRQKYPGDAHVAPGLIRMSVGIEAVEDLWNDLQCALASIGSR
jgi:cystathionine gamma-synthase